MSQAAGISAFVLSEDERKILLNTFEFISKRTSNRDFKEEFKVAKDAMKMRLEVLTTPETKLSASQITLCETLVGGLMDYEQWNAPVRSPRTEADVAKYGFETTCTAMEEETGTTFEKLAEFLIRLRGSNGGNVVEIEEWLEDYNKNKHDNTDA